MYAQAIHEFQAREIERIRGLVAEGKVNSLDLARSPTYGGLFAYRGKLEERLIGIMEQAGEFGRDQVKAELRRQ